MVSRGARFDDASFLVSGRVEDINTMVINVFFFFLNGIIYFLTKYILTQKRVNLLKKKKRIISLGDVLILILQNLCVKDKDMYINVRILSFFYHVFHTIILQN